MFKGKFGRNALCRGFGKVFYCLDAKWRELNGKDGKNDTLFVLDTLVGLNGKSCTAKTLSDGSGYKIVCGEDSMGVVLNGKDGVDGKDGEDGTAGEKGESGKDGENGKDGAGCSLTDLGNGNVLLVCGEDSLALYKAFCAGEPFDPAKSFCLEDSVIALCGGSTFSPAESFCFGDSIYSFCGGMRYAPDSFFCYNESQVELCGEKSYNPDESFCFGDSAYALCGGKKFNPTDSTCHNERLYGFFEDARIGEGRVYRTVKIGDQIWMAENMNTEKAGDCYGNSADSCAKYGRLYDWLSAMAICPQGYHLPTKSEWEILAASVENPLLLHAKNAWNDSVSVEDSFSFGALPAGFYRPADETFYNAGRETFFWTASENENAGGYAWRCGFSENQSSFYFGRNLNIGYRFSVRCVKD